SIILENLPTFNSAFRFEERLRLLETSFNEYRQTNQVAGAVSVIPGIVHQTSYAIAADLLEMELKKILIEKVEGNSDLAKQADARSSFNELLDTPIDFSNFIMHRLNEEVYKATTDQLDWVNPEGQQYPHNLLQPLPLIPDNRGRRQPTDYNKHALWGVSHWGLKRKQFYGYAVNRESAQDVYSKRRIIAVTELQIMEWHDYKHLDWISVRRDDKQIYKFKEGDFKRLRLQDIEDMLLLLVQ
nr:hypothetical protein [Tanacetum cinerariifolium]